MGEVGKYGSAKSVKEVMGGIAHNDYVLPSIQRQFVWKHGQIEELFDSILRGYPFGTFMFWKLEPKTLKKGVIRLYQFNKDIVENKNEDNKEFTSQASLYNVYAVIDGQQRLTALNVGLFGSFAYRKKWAKEDGKYPKRFLYLDILSEVPDSDTDPKRYNFKFLTNEEARSRNEHFWFKVGDILDWEKEDVDAFIKDNELDDVAGKILDTLRSSLNDEGIISYYLVEDQEADQVLDIFIRANSGGTPLSKSDLLMAMATHQWSEVDIRKEMVEVIDEVSDFGRGERFAINRDFVLKTCLVLHSNDVRFLLANFNPDNIKKFENNWPQTRKCIIAAFQYLSKIGFGEKTLQAKGPVIAIIYYIFINDLADRINKPTFDPDGINRKNITTWLVRAFINSLYGGSPDSVHAKVRGVIAENKGDFFPYQQLIEAYRGDGNGLNVSVEALENRLESKFGSEKAGYVLILLYSDLINKSLVDEDHLHPKSIFISGEYKKYIPESDHDFVKKTWNTVLNLQLLDSTLNESKADKPLSVWIKEQNINKEDLFIDEDTSTDLKDYCAFIQTRKRVLLNKLKLIMGIEDDNQMDNGNSDSIQTV